MKSLKPIRRRALAFSKRSNFFLNPLGQYFLRHHPSSWDQPNKCPKLWFQYSCFTEFKLQVLYWINIISCVSKPNLELAATVGRPSVYRAEAEESDRPRVRWFHWWLHEGLCSTLWSECSHSGGWSSFHVNVNYSLFTYSYEGIFFWLVGKIGFRKTTVGYIFSKNYLPLLFIIMFYFIYKHGTKQYYCYQYVYFLGCLNKKHQFLKFIMISC